MLSLPFSPYRLAAKILGILLFALLFHPAAWGAVSLNATRLIMKYGDKEATVRVQNEARYPVLIQGWIDTANRQVSLEEMKVPFVITSPMFRLGPEATQTMRLLFTGAKGTLPEDKESVFWLNIQEVPPNAFVEKGENHMQISFCTRIKLFFRPASIPQNTERLHEQLLFRLVQDNNRPVLQIENPTAIHISVLEIILGNADDPLMQIAPKEEMIAPFGTVRLPLSRTDKNLDGALLTYFFINDFGAVIEKQTQVGSAK